MTRVGTFEAKTHLTHLLERVAKGERIAITNRGKPVAMLVPFDTENERDTARMGREMLAYRDRVKPRPWQWAVSAYRSRGAPVLRSLHLSLHLARHGLRANVSTRPIPPVR